MAGEHTHAGTGVRRRTVLKGAAWSVPVVAAAVAVPAWAAVGSPGTPKPINQGSVGACWDNGNNKLRVTVAPKDASGNPIDLSQAKILVDVGNHSGAKAQIAATSGTISESNLQNETATITAIPVNQPAVFVVDYENGNFEKKTGVHDISVVVWFSPTEQYNLTVHVTGPGMTGCVIA